MPKGIWNGKIVIVPFGLKGIHDFDFDKAEELIRGGITARLTKIPEIKAAIKTKLQKIVNSKDSKKDFLI